MPLSSDPHMKSLPERARYSHHWDTVVEEDESGKRALKGLIEEAPVVICRLRIRQRGGGCPRPPLTTPIPRHLNNKYSQSSCIIHQSLLSMADATESGLPNEQLIEPPIENGNNSTPSTEAEVQNIIASIKEASSRPSTPTTTSSPDIDEFDEGAYWDLSSMAPLNAVSAVST